MCTVQNLSSESIKIISLFLKTKRLSLPDAPPPPILYPLRIEVKSDVQSGGSCIKNLSVTCVLSIVNVIKTDNTIIWMHRFTMEAVDVCGMLFIDHRRLHNDSR